MCACVCVCVYLCVCVCVGVGVGVGVGVCVWVGVWVCVRMLCSDAFYISSVKVLRRKLGIPITLCIIYSAVARRLGVHLEPVRRPFMHCVVQMIISNF